MSPEHNDRFPTDRETLERDVEVDFVRASGPGGQHRNRRETGVRLTHAPSGLVVMATERRSQARNLEVAWERLIERLEAMNEVRKKRLATKTPRAVKRRRLVNKRRRSAVKAMRRPVKDDAP